MSHRFQFSLRSLFWLTAVVAVVVGTMSMLGRTHSFRALGSHHAYLALLPIAGVWVAWRTRLLTGRRLTIIAIIFYAMSFVLPAIRLDDHSHFGYFAFLYSYWGATLFAEGGASLSFPIACMLGILANLCFAITLLAVALGRAGPTSDLHRPSLPAIALRSSIASLVPLGLTGNLDAIYIGYGVWVAAMLAMWLGVREGKPNPDEEEPLIDANDR